MLLRMPAPVLAATGVFAALSLTAAGAKNPVIDGVVEVVAHVPAAKPGAPLLEDELLVEAEHFDFLTYGWEIVRDPNAGGGLCIFLPENTGDFESEDMLALDPSLRAGDFFNATGDARPIEARASFFVRAQGRFAVWVRIMAHWTNCSNIAGISVNNGPRRRAGRNHSEPFAWLWHFAGTAELHTGTNHVSFRAFQDGVSVDQVLFTRVPGRNLQSTKDFLVSPQRQTFSSAPVLSPATDTLVLNTGTVLAAWVSGVSATSLPVTVTFKFTTPEHVYSNSVALDDEFENPVEIRWKPSLPAGLPAREYLAGAILKDVNGHVLDRRTLVFTKPWDWHVLGPLPLTGRNDNRPETDARPRVSYGEYDGENHVWQRFPVTAFDRQGLLDFRTAFRDRLRNGQTRSRVYAYTEIECRQPGERMLKVQGDDDIAVWLNGNRVAAINDRGPVIRTAREFRAQLETGRNRLLFRLDRHDAHWKGAVRIRMSDHTLADDTGIPFDSHDFAK